MLCRRAGQILAAALLVVVVLPSTAAAQQQNQGRGRLYWPTIAAGGAATADWITTYHALKFYRVREQNPLLKPLDHTPMRMVSVGGLIDVAGISAWNLTVGPKHDKIAAAGLWTMTAFRVYLAVHNHLNEHRAEPR
jgi:hypothetical protein